MLEAGARLLQYRGYHGTSLNDILEASGAPRGSFYFHFPGGKDQLAVEATRAAIDIASHELSESLRTAPTPGSAVRRYAEAAAEIMRESDYTFGCPVAPVILDANGGNPDLEALCKAAFEEWSGSLRRSFEAAGIGKARARSLALMVNAAIEGALVIARAYRDEGALREVALELEALIDADLPKRRAGRARRSA